MTLGPIRRITRSESTASPGSSTTMLVRAQVRKPSSDRPTCVAPWRTWAMASGTAMPRGGMANTKPSPYTPASCMARGPNPETYSGMFGSRFMYLCSWGSYLRRDNLVSVLYAEELNSTKSSVFLQRTDRHGILGQKSSDFQRFL